MTNTNKNVKVIGVMFLFLLAIASVVFAQMQNTTTTNPDILSIQYLNFIKNYHISASQLNGICKGIVPSYINSSTISAIKDSIICTTIPPIMPIRTNTIQVIQQNQFNPKMLNITAINNNTNLYNGEIKFSAQRINCSPKFDTLTIAWGDGTLNIVHFRDGNLSSGSFTTSNLCKINRTGTGSEGIIGDMGISSNGNSTLYFYHEYKKVGTYNVSVADLYNYSGVVPINVSASSIPVPVLKELMVQTGQNMYSYYPINTTNTTLADYICKFAPVTLNSPFFATQTQYGNLYNLSTQKALADIAQGIIANDSWATYWESSGNC